MPYNMRGGDTPESTAWMERCVAAVMKDGKEKSNAIAICKAAYARHKAQTGRPTRLFR